RSRMPSSIGSNQSSNRQQLASFFDGCARSGFVLRLVMAWSPVQRANAGRFEVENPGDYAAFNSNQPRYGTHRLSVRIVFRIRLRRPIHGRAAAGGRTHAGLAVGAREAGVAVAAGVAGRGCFLVVRERVRGTDLLRDVAQVTKHREPRWLEIVSG